MKVTLPNPCAEKYDNIPPTELGRMCKVCNTEVIDFTNWETKDIVAYIQKSNQKVCGRINTQTTPIKGILRKKWFKYITAALAVGNLGTLLYAKDYPIQSYHSAIAYNQVDSVSVQILDTQNRPLGDILLINKADNRKFHTDKKGFVKLPICCKEIYSITQIGYKKQELKICKKIANKL